MTRHAVVTGLMLYRTGTVTLEQAANCGGTTAESFETTLRARGIPVREPDDAVREPDDAVREPDGESRASADTA